MTRINATISPEKLCDQHLLAEYREILRVVWLATRRPVDVASLPKLFTLGDGHVKFFYDKLRFVELRFDSLRSELLVRGYSAAIVWDGARVAGHDALYNDWKGTPSATQLILGRIGVRAAVMKKITLAGEPLTLAAYKAHLGWH